MLFCAKFRYTVPETITITQCPLCGGTDLKPVLTCVDHYASGEMFHLCCCQRCKFLFTQGFPDEASIEPYYASENYISHNDSREGLMNRIYHYVRGKMLQRKAELIEKHSYQQQGRLLDIGTGTGHFAAFMKQRGWLVDAVEKSDQARNFAYEHFDLDVYRPCDLQRLQRGSYDVITLWHVMEHLEQLNETWEHLHRLLAPRGVLIVAAPNHSSYDAKKYGAYWAAYDVPRHLWHFSPDTMQRFGAKHGFILAERYPMPFDAFYVSILTERYMRHTAAFVRGMFTGVLAYIASLFKKERSSSMIYVFRKK